MFKGALYNENIYRKTINVKCGQFFASLSKSKRIRSVGPVRWINTANRTQAERQLEYIRNK